MSARISPVTPGMEEKQTHLKIGCAETCEKNRQERRSNIGDAHTDRIDLHVAEIPLLDLNVIFSMGMFMDVLMIIMLAGK